MRRIFIIICVSALFVSLLFKVSASRNSESNRHIKIYLDDYALSMVSPYLPCGKPLRNVTFESSELDKVETFKNLPRYPLSQKVVSVVNGRNGVLLYETASDINPVNRYYLREMKRMGWNLCSEREFQRGVFLFHKGESICLLHLERNSGVTNITIVYQERRRK